MSLASFPCPRVDEAVRTKLKNTLNVNGFEYVLVDEVSKENSRALLFNHREGDFDSPR